mmetsp:Transcript_4530/g.16253  ORF Transcript_4530/g.16253 Transcript_4530/m.16253 type:complete len:250 (-) Transcript_4530:703-1452(-)
MEARVSEANAAGTRIPQPARRDASAAAAESEACIAAKHPAAGPMEQRSPSRWVRGREVSTMAAARRHADPAAAARANPAGRMPHSAAPRRLPSEAFPATIATRWLAHRREPCWAANPSPSAREAQAHFRGEGRPAEDTRAPSTRRAFPSARARAGRREAGVRRRRRRRCMSHHPDARWAAAAMAQHEPAATATGSSQDAYQQCPEDASRDLRGGPTPSPSAHGAVAFRTSTALLLLLHLPEHSCSTTRV